jgi:hypothetical protein
VSHATAVIARSPDRFARAEIPVTSVDDLRRLTNAQRARVFRDGVAPDGVRPVEGTPACYGIGADALARIPGVERLLLAALDRYWHGKTFVSLDERRGWGYNRATKGALLHILPFKTDVRASQLDGKPCFALDYDVPRNPRFQRTCLDELREVAPGLFFGTGCFRILGKYRILGWWAFDTNDQTPMIGTDPAR